MDLFACRRFFLLVATSLFVFLSPISFATATDLLLFVTKQGDTITVRAVSPFDTLEYTIDSEAGLIDKLEQIYDRIERRPEKTGTLDKVGAFFDQQYRSVREAIPFWKENSEEDRATDESTDQDALTPLLAAAGNLLLTPVAPLLAISSRVGFVVDEECLYYPFDALHVDGVPLFLKKPVFYALTEPSPTSVKASIGWRGLVVANAETDPQKGIDTVYGCFPESLRLDADTVRPETMVALQPVDFILVSADGGIDGLQLKHLVLKPNTLSALAPKLVYLDCNLYGINLNFIRQFHKSGVGVYVAPIFSRLNGSVSAQTMIRFFRALKNGDRPAQALLLARKTLYDSQRLDNENEVTALRSAFPFRVYQLN
ncbi:hypothetical protein DSCO28_43010 [Desulfosarcina ovata subsp. sediminis]|uniref:CHAT domain-containing protein n=1 Tax=Desulfosarcina ovata subsp. sediminis TaxID=885957 RepID=A0A5K7ZU30_9BACT|nr:hypothetical protein [Desulfosarcina ovata]BBO83735.1 hypothetical protein DSCO28_43010 [Desulfosarcina ovata subsp. sediminis]